MANSSDEERPTIAIRERFGSDVETVAGFITAEHAALEAARSATIFEANGRVASFLATLSGAVVALAFIGEASALGRPFYVFLFVLLPAVLFLGVVTFERAVQSSVEDGRLARRVNRLRRFYFEYHPAVGEYLDSPAEDTSAAVMRQSGITMSPWQLFLTAAGSVGVLNSVIAGALVGLIADLAFGSLLASAFTGVVGFVLSEAVHVRRQVTSWR